MLLNVISTMIRAVRQLGEDGPLLARPARLLGGISTRATREPPTVPVRGQPAMSAIGFRPSRALEVLDRAPTRA